MKGDLELQLHGLPRNGTTADLEKGLDEVRARKVMIRIGSINLYHYCFRHNILVVPRRSVVGGAVVTWTRY